MKTCPRLTVLFLSAMLVSFAGIVAAVVLHAAPQDCSRFQNEDADLLLAAAASRMQSDEAGFPSPGYDSVGRTLNRSSETHPTRSARPAFLLKPVRFLAENLSTRTSFAPPANSRLQLLTWLSPRLKARADPPRHGTALSLECTVPVSCM